MEKYVSTATLAELLDVSQESLKQWRADRTGPPWIKLGHGPRGHIRYPLAGLQGWLDSLPASEQDTRIPVASDA